MNNTNAPRSITEPLIAQSRTGEAEANLTDVLERDVFDITDSVIEQAYPNIYGLEKGMWGHQRIPNFGILRGAIARAIFEERKRSNV